MMTLFFSIIIYSYDYILVESCTCTFTFNYASDLYWCLTTWREVNQNRWEKPKWRLRATPQSILQKPQKKRKQSKMVVLLEDVSSKVYLLWCNTQTHYVKWRHLCLPVLSDILRFQSRTDVDVSGLKLKRWSTVAFSGRLCYVKVSDASLWLIRQSAANLLVNSSTLRLLSPSTVPSVWAPPPPPHMALRARSPVDFNKILCPTMCLLTRDQFPWQQRIL